MKYTVSVLLFFILYLWEITSIYAQWEKVGWPFPSRNLVYVSGTNLFASRGYYDLSTSFLDSLIVSTDNGATWATKLFFDHNQTSHAKWVKKDSKVYAGGIDKDSLNATLFISNDDGDTWNIYCKLPSKGDISDMFLKGDTIVLMVDHYRDVYYLGSEMFYSINAGNNWGRVKFPFNSTGFSISYKDSTLLFLDYNGYLSYTFDFGNTWLFVISPPHFLNGADAISIFDNKWFYTGHNSSGNDDIFYTYYSTNQGLSWKQSNGLDLNMESTPSYEENNILFASGFNFLNGLNNEGRNALFISIDTGKNWKQSGGYFTNGTDIFSGTEYFFLGGTNEVWRLPKSNLSKPISKQVFANHITITPNPASGNSIVISFALPTTERSSLVIFDVLGRAQFKKDIAPGSSQLEIPVRNFTEGTYYVQLTSSSGSQSASFVRAK